MVAAIAGRPTLITRDNPMKQGPLSGIRVIDLTSVVFGPYATQHLGDMGADVVKIEGPEGDITRWILPTRNPGMAGTFLNSNRNKRSVVIDLKTAEGREALLEIAAGADVFVHNLRPQAIRKLKLTYTELKAVNPRLVFCNAWGFGSGGPYAERPAYDDVIQAMSGVADLARRQTGGAPALAPTILADKTSGLMLCQAILLAIIHRLKTGEGQEIEVPMYETMVSYVMLEHLSGGVYEPPEPKAGEALGYARVLAPHRKPYKTADGFMTVLPYTDKHWRAFFTAAGRPELVGDKRFASVGARSSNIAELYALVAELMPARRTAEWLAILTEADIPHVAVKRLEDLLEDEHLTALDFFPEYDHPSEGRVRTTAVPIRLSASPGHHLRRVPPRLGEHTVEVLREAGIDSKRIDALLRSGAVRQAEQLARPGSAKPARAPERSIES
jgi:crotonobetainyl-CoA:carnitine CoA-transferase CaiB-like acyl-CoA transferase